MRTKMKMVPVTVTLFLLCCSVIASGDNCDVYGETGKTLTLPMTVTENVNMFKLRFGEKIIIHQKGEKNIQQHNDRLGLLKNGSLILKNLQKSDEGIYKLEIYDRNGQGIGNTNQIHLCVQDSVKTPQLKMECVKPDNVKFTCTPDSNDKAVQFGWLKNSKKYEGKSKEPNKLTLSAKSVEKDSFSCTVFNKVSSQNSTALKQTCIEAASSFPEQLFGISIWIFVGGGGAIVLALIIILIFCCIRTRQKKRTRMMDAEEMRLAWGHTDEQRNQHPAHNHSHRPHPHDSDYENQHQQQGPGQTGPRQPRPRNQRPRAPEPTESHPNPMPRRGVQAPTPPKKDDDEEPPPLPQPRKKAQKIQKV